MNVIEDSTSQVRQHDEVGHERVELVAVEDQERKLVVPVDVFVEDLDSDDVADDIGGAVVVASDPDQAEVVAVGVPADDLQAGEVTLGESREVQVIEDISVDDQFTRLMDPPLEEFLEEFCLADVAAQMQVADNEAVVKRLHLDLDRFIGLKLIHVDRPYESGDHPGL